MALVTAVIVIVVVILQKANKDDKDDDANDIDVMALILSDLFLFFFVDCSHLTLWGERGG